MYQCIRLSGLDPSEWLGKKKIRGRNKVHYIKKKKEDPAKSLSSAGFERFSFFFCVDFVRKGGISSQNNMPPMLKSKPSASRANHTEEPHPGLHLVD